MKKVPKYKIGDELMYKDGSDGGTVKIISYNKSLQEYDYYLIPDESFLIDGQNLSVDEYGNLDLLRYFEKNLTYNLQKMREKKLNELL
jgi:hypothetical protein